MLCCVVLCGVVLCCVVLLHCVVLFYVVSYYIILYYIILYYIILYYISLEIWSSSDTELSFGALIEKVFRDVILDIEISGRTESYTYLLHGAESFLRS